MATPTLLLLPDELVETHVLPHLGLQDVSALCASARRLRRITAPVLHRKFRCTTCRSSLFRPRDLVDVSDAWRLLDALPLHSDALPRRSFFELSDACVPNVLVDRQHGKANFLALRHLRQTGIVEASSNVTVGVLRCNGCGVYVGFLSATAGSADAKPGHAAEESGDRAGSLGPEGSPPAVEDGALNGSVGHARELSRGRPLCQPPFRGGRIFVGREYVELVNGKGVRVNHRGDELPSPSHDEASAEMVTWNDVGLDSNKLETGVFCSTRGCGSRLFDKDDVLPWSHVLASTRLADMDAYLEWEHAWGVSRPAVFVRRLAVPHTVRNVRRVDLRQGAMEVGDVSCQACDRHLGWRFLSELSRSRAERLCNFDQVGRFGIFRDSVRLRSASLSPSLLPS
jgi:hypothetical protein